MSRKRLSPNDYSAISRTNLDANFARIGFREFTLSGIATQYRYWVGAYTSGDTITFAAYNGTNGAGTVLDEASGRTAITATGDQFHPVNAPFAVVSGNTYGVGADWDASGNIQYYNDGLGYNYRSITPPPWPEPFAGAAWTWSLCIELWGHVPPVVSQVNGGSDISDGMIGVQVDGNDFVDFEDSGVNPKAWLWSSSTFDPVNAVEQTVTSIGDTQLEVTIDAGALSTGTVYMFVETGFGQISAGSPITLAEAGINGSFESVEAAETGSFSGNVALSGSFESVEAAEVGSLSGTVALSGSFESVEAAEVGSLSGTVALSGSFESVEAAETGSFSGTVSAGVSGTFESVEEAESGSFSGNVAIYGLFESVETEETGLFSGDFSVSGLFESIEPAEIGSLSGNVVIYGLLESVEEEEVGSFHGTVSTGEYIPSTSLIKTLAGDSIILVTAGDSLIRATG